jgi:hypothetical protein
MKPFEERSLSCFEASVTHPVQPIMSHLGHSSFITFKAGRAMHRSFHQFSYPYFIFMTLDFHNHLFPKKIAQTVIDFLRREKGFGHNRKGTGKDIFAKIE